MSKLEIIIELIIFLVIVVFLLWVRHGANKHKEWLSKQPKDFQDKWNSEFEKRGMEESLQQ